MIRVGDRFGRWTVTLVGERTKRGHMVEATCECGLVRKTTEYKVQSSAMRACNHTIASRFWPRIDKNGPVHPTLGTPCWVWTGSLRGGYGQFTISRKPMKASRVAWQLTRGPIPGPPGHSGTLVLHHCDNPKCCNPEHLFLGTHKDNAEDRNRKARQARGAKSVPKTIHRGDAHWSRRMPERRAHGEGHGCAKLTAERVREIRSLRRQGVTLIALARQFGVAHSLISMICLRKIWKDVA